MSASTEGLQTTAEADHRDQSDGESVELPRVLAVDDQPDSLRLLQIRLEAGGMKCFPFSDGRSALEFLKTNEVDTIILDVMMPEMDGYEVCRRIKEDERIRDIPVLFLTAKLEPADKVQGLEIGGQDYLSKPVQQQELLARTKAAIRVKQLQDQLKHTIELKDQVHQLHRGMLTEHWLKTLGQLAASLAHEINNPLAAALGNVQLLRMRPDLMQDLQHPLEVIDKSLQRAGQKLRSLLLIAQAGQHPQEVDLAELVQDLVTVINFQAVMSKVAITFSLDSSCRWAGIPGELARALLYIFNNAIEAVHGGEKPLMKIAVANEGASSSITVLDNGGGIPEDLRTKVFEPFFTTKPPHQGVGLHLAQEIIKAAGGTIEIAEPEAGWSTAIRVYLPAMT